MKRMTSATIVALAMLTGAGLAWADDVTALQPIQTYGDSPDDARERARLLAQMQCDRNTRLIRAFRELRGVCRYEESSGQWFCYSQKFRCVEQH